ncbi:MAG: repeat protein [Labilithrix sp.]|nr:repeat protein [Labilithrix sp.]
MPVARPRISVIPMPTLSPKRLSASNRRLLGSLAAVVALGAGGCSSSEPDAALGTSSDEQNACPGGKHECAGWGATCAGASLTTCVVGEDGCRKLLTQPCSLGCDAGACKTCDALTVPKRGSSLATPTAFYHSLVRKGNVAIASWRGRSAEYTLSTRGFTAVDLTSPDALAPLGTTALPDNQDALSLHIEGDHVFGIAPGRLQIWNAANPASLTALGSYVPASAPTSLAVSGSVAYVGTAVGVDLVDVSNAAAPTLLGVVATSVPAAAMVVAGSRLAVAGGSAVEIVDVSDPTAPKLLAKSTFGATIYSQYAMPLAFDGTRLAVAGTTSYGQDLWAQLSTFELTPGGALEHRGGMGGLTNVTKLAFDGSELVIDTGDAVGTLDVTDLRTPKWKKHAFLGQGFQISTDVVRDGSLLYTTGTGGVSAVDLDRASDVTLLPSDADWLGGSATKGSVAYLARARSGLVIEDLRDPKAPVVLSRTAMNASSIALEGYLAYVAVRDEGLRIYDVRSPWKPELVGKVAAPMVGGVSVHAGRAYAMCGIGYTCVFDVSQPLTPTLLVKSDAILRAQGSSSAWQPFVMRGSQLYLPSPDKLMILDLATPSAPVTTGQVALGGGYSAALVALGPSHAYVAYDCHNVSGDTCIDVVDIADPTRPQKVATITHDFEMGAGFYQTLNASARRSTMHVAGHHLFLTNEWGGVLVVDVSTPTAPRSLGELWTSLPGRDHFVSDRTLRVYTEASFPFPAPAAAQDQIIELCK